MMTETPCPHPPQRLYAWHAFNYRTGKNDILCVACCDCGAVLEGNAAAERDDESENEEEAICPK
jgi:hypothetical protein